MSYPAPYPYMRVAFGFIGGGILLAFVSAILRYPFILGSPSSLLPVLRSIVLLQLACALPLTAWLLWRRVTRTRDGIRRTIWMAVVLGLLVHLGIMVYSLRDFPLLPGEQWSFALLLSQLLPILGEVTLTAVIYGLLSTRFLPPAEDTDDTDSAPPDYPYVRVICAFPLLTGLLYGVLYCLLILVLFRSIRLGNIPKDMSLLFMPGMFLGLWLAAWRVRRTSTGIIHVLTAVIVPAMFIFPLFAANSVYYGGSGVEINLAAILTARLALAVLIVALIFLPPEPHWRTTTVDFIMLAILGLSWAALCIVLTVGLFPYLFTLIF